jgi:hypothetical protein
VAPAHPPPLALPPVGTVDHAKTHGPPPLETAWAIVGGQAQTMGALVRAFEDGTSKARIRCLSLKLERERPLLEKALSAIPPDRRDDPRIESLLSAHQLDSNDARLAGAMTAWARSRAPSLELMSMNEAASLRQGRPETRYGPDEKVLIGRFHNPYTGKMVGGRAAEVCSTGAEWFDTPERMLTLLFQDREHFELVLGAIRS